MEEIKLTDEEVVKSLECCSFDAFACRDDECPLSGVKGCTKIMASNALELIRYKDEYIAYLKRKLDAKCVTYRNGVDMKEKKIHIYFINKIKNLDYKIFEYQDEDQPNYRAVQRCEIHIRKWLEKAGVWGEKAHQEILSCINWADDNCVEKLEKLGWTVIRGIDEWKKRN